MLLLVSEPPAPRRVAIRPRPEVRRRVDYAAELNREQLEAVMHPGGPMLVLAGAGSGKTRTLVYRVARLLEDGVKPSQVLLLTFTNRAAREMLDRVGRLLGRDASRVMGGTFHSVGNRLLRRWGEQLGYRSSYGILDREDARDLMGAALAEVVPSAPPRRLPGAAALVEIYSLCINTGRAVDEIVPSRYPQFASDTDTIAEVFRRYLERKRAGNVMDYDDLLLNWLLLLRRHEEIRRTLQARFSHLLVDEYQDTNRLQADIVDTMLPPRPQPRGGGRRRPVDLRLPGRRVRQHPLLPRTVPRLHHVSAGNQLPLVAPHPGAGQRFHRPQPATVSQEPASHPRGR